MNPVVMPVAYPVFVIDAFQAFNVSFDNRVFDIYSLIYNKQKHLQKMFNDISLLDISFFCFEFEPPRYHPYDFTFTIMNSIYCCFVQVCVIIRVLDMSLVIFAFLTLLLFVYSGVVVTLLLEIILVKGIFSLCLKVWCFLRSLDFISFYIIIGIFQIVLKLFWFLGPLCLDTLKSSTSVSLISVCVSLE